MKILLFSPLSSIWPNKALEIALSRAIKKLGHEVFELQCEGYLAPTCPGFNEAGVSDSDLSEKDRVRICNICKSRSSSAIHLTNNEVVKGLGTYTNKVGAVDNDVQIARLSSDWESWPITIREAAYEILVNTKADGIKLSSNFLKQLESAHANRLHSYKVAHEELRRGSFDMLIVSDVFYSMNAGAWAAAGDLGIQRVTIGSALNFRKNGNAFSLFRSSDAQALISRSSDWGNTKLETLSRAEIRVIRRNEKYNLTAKSPFTYSSSFRPTSPKTLRSKLGIQNDLPIVLVITTTNDERFAARVSGKLPNLKGPRNFKSQIEFLETVIETARSNPEVNFVVRLHPRLLPNKRDSVASPYLQRLEAVFEGAPENIFLNVPSQGISLANIGLASQVALNWTSTAGLDLLTLGIPVVSCEPNETFSYPPEIGLELQNPLQLKQVIEGAIGLGHNSKFAVAAFRYKNFISKHLTLKISDFAPQRRRFSFFRFMNWARLRGRVSLPSFLAQGFDRLDGGRFNLSSDEIVRLQLFLNKDLQNLPPKRSPRNLSIEAEQELIWKSLKSLKAGSSYSL